MSRQVQSTISSKVKDFVDNKSKAVDGKVVQLIEKFMREFGLANFKMGNLLVEDDNSFGLSFVDINRKLLFEIPELAAGKSRIFPSLGLQVGKLEYRDRVNASYHCFVEGRIDTENTPDCASLPHLLGDFEGELRNTLDFLDA